MAGGEERRRGSCVLLLFKSWIKICKRRMLGIRVRWSSEELLKSRVLRTRELPWQIEWRVVLGWRYELRFSMVYSSLTKRFVDSLLRWMRWKVKMRVILVAWLVSSTNNLQHQLQTCSARASWLVSCQFKDCLYFVGMKFGIDNTWTRYTIIWLIKVRHSISRSHCRERLSIDVTVKANIWNEGDPSSSPRS